jgi:hypothetical protein
MAKDNQTRKATDKLKADDLEAIADWRIQKKQLNARYVEESRATDYDLDSKARRAARKVGLVACRCRT